MSDADKWVNVNEMDEFIRKSFEEYPNGEVPDSYRCEVIDHGNCFEIYVYGIYFASYMQRVPEITNGCPDFTKPFKNNTLTPHQMAKKIAAMVRVYHARMSGK